MVSFEEFIASCESQIAPLVKEALEEYRRYLEYNWLKLRDGDEIEVSLDYPHDVVKEVARLWNEGTGWTATSKGLFTLVFRGQGAQPPTPQDAVIGFEEFIAQCRNKFEAELKEAEEYCLEYLRLRWQALETGNAIEICTTYDHRVLSELASRWSAKGKGWKVIAQSRQTLLFSKS